MRLEIIYLNVGIGVVLKFMQKQLIMEHIGILKMGLREGAKKQKEVARLGERACLLNKDVADFSRAEQDYKNKRSKTTAPVVRTYGCFN